MINRHTIQSEVVYLFSGLERGKGNRGRGEGERGRERERKRNRERGRWKRRGEEKLPLQERDRKEGRCSGRK